jgi:hypothetical protein
MKIHSLLPSVIPLLRLNAGAQQQRPKIVAKGGTPDDRAAAQAGQRESVVPLCGDDPQRPAADPVRPREVWDPLDPASGPWAAASAALPSCFPTSGRQPANHPLYPKATKFFYLGRRMRIR